eukprot:GHVS01016021.1.p1 GENE.GHVS01016021.1~~GHVS01016021.1.p1  ORF type:complete len:478 (-),score=41.62 GHVS01016021.1:33-1466(-)
MYRTRCCRVGHFLGCQPIHLYFGMICFYRSLWMILCSVFLNVLSFALLAFAADHLHVLLAVPKGFIPKLNFRKLDHTISEDVKPSPVDIPSFLSDYTLVNNIHAILALVSETDAPTSPSRAVVRSVQPTDDIFAWKGRLFWATENDADTKLMEPIRITFDVTSGFIMGLNSYVVSADNFYMFRCHYRGCVVFPDSIANVLGILKRVGGDKDRPFADLLYNWIDGDPSEGDPSKKLSLCSLRALLDAEADIRKKDMAEELEKWKTFEKTWQENANENIEAALACLKIWQEKQLRLAEVEVTWQSTQQAYTLNNIENALDELVEEKAKGIRWRRTRVAANVIKLRVPGKAKHEVLYIKSMQFGHGAVGMYYDAAESSYRRQMKIMQTMWEQLYEEEQHGEDVLNARSILIKRGEAVFSDLKKLGTPLEATLFTTAFLNKEGLADAYQMNIDSLSKFAAEQQVRDPDGLSERLRARTYYQ